MDGNTTVAKLKKQVSEFRDSRDWLRHDTPRSLAISISVEAAELFLNSSILAGAFHESADLPPVLVVDDDRRNLSYVHLISHVSMVIVVYDAGLYHVVLRDCERLG